MSAGTLYKYEIRNRATGQILVKTDPYGRQFEHRPKTASIVTPELTYDWQDSGWIKGIDIAYPSVYVQVLYYSGPGADPVVMKIVNPAPGTEYGWLGRGMCHALEVGWADKSNLVLRILLRLLVLPVAFLLF